MENKFKVIANNLSNFDIKVNKSVQDIWSKYRQLSASSTEACGVLIGGYLPKYKGFSVDECTIPGAADIRKRYFYIMRDKHHQKAMDKAYKRSKGTTYFLGTWHTHPEQFPKPSKKDLYEWKKLMNQNRADIPSFLFVIVGTKQTSFFPFNNYYFYNNN